MTQLDDIDLAEEISMESVSEYNICESEEIVVTGDLSETKKLKDSTQLFHLELATSLPELLVDETMLTVSIKTMCNKCGKIFQWTDIYRRHKRTYGRLIFLLRDTTKFKF